MTCCTCTGIFCLVPHDYKKGRWDMPSFYRVGNENSEMLNQVIQLIRSRARIWTRICVIPEPILDLPQLCCSSTRKKKSKYDMTGVYVHRDNCYRQAREKKLVLRETLSSCLWPPENTVALLLNRGSFALARLVHLWWVCVEPSSLSSDAAEWSFGFGGWDFFSWLKLISSSRAGTTGSVLMLYNNQ